MLLNSCEPAQEKSEVVAGAGEHGVRSPQRPFRCRFSWVSLIRGCGARVGRSMRRSKAIHVVSPSEAGVGSTTESTLTPGGSSVCPRRVLGGWEWLRLEPVAWCHGKALPPGDRRRAHECRRPLWQVEKFYAQLFCGNEYFASNKTVQSIAWTFFAARQFMSNARTNHIRL